MRFVGRLLAGIVGLAVLLYAGLIVYAYWPRDYVSAESLATSEDRFATVPAGRLRYREYGSATPGRVELVLIHGFANNLHSFRELAPRLAESFRVVAVDLPGFGLSSKPSDGRFYAYGSMADAVIAAGRAAGLTRPVYVGHSLGGVIALRAGVQDGRAAGIVFIEPGIFAGQSIQAMSPFSFFPLSRVVALQFGRREFREAMISRAYRDPSLLSDEDIDNLMLAARTDDYLDGMATLLRDVPAGDEEIALLDQVDMPVLTFWAASGSHVPHSSDRLQQHLPRSKTVLLDDAGHYLHEEQPDRVSAEIRAFFMNGEQE